jgi:hypothetical protein
LVFPEGEQDMREIEKKSYRQRFVSTTYVSVYSSRNTKNVSSVGQSSALETSFQRTVVGLLLR